MDRRQFLGTVFASSIATGVRLAIPARALAASSAAVQPGQKRLVFGAAHRASVTDFGADPTGVKDATAAVRRAIASLAQMNARLVFPPGKYSFTAPERLAMSFREFEGLEVFGNGAELNFSGNMQPLFMQSCKNVEIHDLKLDWARPAFSQGFITAVGPQGFTFTADPEFPLDGTEGVDWFAEYDPGTGLPAQNGVDGAGTVASVQPAGRQDLAVSLNRPLALRSGMRLLVQHRTGGAPCFQLQGCETVLLESVTLHAAPGTGAVLEGCRELSFEDFSILPRAGSKRWMSAGGSGLRLVDCMGAVGAKRCEFTGTGENAVEIHQSYWKLVTRVDERTVLVEGRGQRPLETWQLPDQGSILQLSDAAHLGLLGEIALLRAENSGGKTQFTFKETLSPIIGAGTLLCNALAQPRTVFDHCSFKGNRGNGIVAHGRTRIINSQFSGCSESAVLLAADPGAMEGPTVQSVTIADSSFSGCNYAQTGQRRGTITVDGARGLPPSATQPERVNQGVTIQRNHFSQEAGPAIECVSTSWLTVEGNIFGKTDALAAGAQMPRAVVLRNVDESFLDGNQSKTKQAIVMIGCTEKVQTSDNGLLADVKQG